MRILTQAKLKLANMLDLKFGSVDTDQGILEYDGDGQLEEGMEVFQEDADGNRIPAPDGKYVCEDQVVVVSGGVVEQIKPTAEAKKEKLKKRFNNEAVTRQEFDELKAKVDELAAIIGEVDKTGEEMAAIREQVKALDGQFGRMVRTPLKEDKKTMEAQRCKRDSQLSKFGIQ